MLLKTEKKGNHESSNKPVSKEQIQHLLILSTRCNNKKAVFDLLQYWNQSSYLKRREGRTKVDIPLDSKSNNINLFDISQNGKCSCDGDTLLHILCKDYGWSPCIELIVEYNLYYAHSRKLIQQQQQQQQQHQHQQDDKMKNDKDKPNQRRF